MLNPKLPQCKICVKPAAAHKARVTARADSAGIYRELDIVSYRIQEGPEQRLVNVMSPFRTFFVIETDIRAGTLKNTYEPFFNRCRARWSSVVLAHHDTQIFKYSPSG